MRAAIVPVTAFQQNCTLLWCTETNKAAFVDPGGDLPKPFLCSSQALATVKVTTDMTSTPHDAQVIIEGYW